MRIQEFHRREFLRFLAASPFAVRAFAQDSMPAITRAQDALNVMDFEPLAHKALPPAHWGYLSGGVDDDLTVRMNREAFAHYQLRAWRLVDVSKTDLKINVFGAAWDMPIYVSAVGAQQALHPRSMQISLTRPLEPVNSTEILSCVLEIPVPRIGAYSRPAA